jgi:gluconate 2-dehydrogenase subunit 3-like protein
MTMPTLASPSRRSLLKRGLLGGGLLLLGGAGFLATRGTRRGQPPPRPLSVLSEDEYAVMEAFTARIVAPGPGAPPLDEAAWNADQILTLVDPSAQKEVKRLLGLFESALGGFLFGLRTRPFTRLDPAEQDEVLREWHHSRLLVRRTGFSALKTLALAGYYSTSRTWAYMSYPGPPMEFHDPNAPVWKGNGQPRPDSPGVYKEEESEGTFPDAAETRAP